MINNKYWHATKIKAINLIKNVKFGCPTKLIKKINAIHLYWWKNNTVLPNNAHLQNSNCPIKEWEFVFEIYKQVIWLSQNFDKHN